VPGDTCVPAISGRNMKTTLMIAAILASGSLVEPARADEVKSGRVHYDFDLPPSKTLSLNIRSADVVIEGSDAPKLVISFDGEKSDQATDVKVTFKDKGDTVECGITDGPYNDFRILIEVPRHLNLIVRMPFGTMQISQVVGSKDVSLHSGDLNIAIGNPADYGHVEASVGTGEIDASAFHFETGGFARKFRKDGPGTFRLLVHIGAGQITLQ
jgi:hypothetical protein